MPRNEANEWLFHPCRSVIDACSLQKVRPNSRFPLILRLTAHFCPGASLFLKIKLLSSWAYDALHFSPPLFSFLVIAKGIWMNASWPLLHAFACVAPPHRGI